MKRRVKQSIRLAFIASDIHKTIVPVLRKGKEVLSDLKDKFQIGKGNKLLELLLDLSLKFKILSEILAY